MIAFLKKEDCVNIHVYLQDIILMKIVCKYSRLIKTNAKSGIKLINTQSIADVPCGIMSSHGMVSIVDYALCTNPRSMCVVFMCGVRDLSVGSCQKEGCI